MSNQIKYMCFGKYASEYDLRHVFTGTYEEMQKSANKYELLEHYVVLEA